MPQKLDVPYQTWLYSPKFTWRPWKIGSWMFFSKNWSMLIWWRVIFWAHWSPLVPFLWRIPMWPSFCVFKVDVSTHTHHMFIQLTLLVSSNTVCCEFPQSIDYIFLAAHLHSVCDFPASHVNRRVHSMFAHVNLYSDGQGTRKIRMLVDSPWNGHFYGSMA